MVAIPASPKWSVRILKQKDTAAAVRFLEKEPMKNAYLISRIQDDGIGPEQELLEVRQGAETICVASLSSNIVVASNPDAHPSDVSVALTLIADRIAARAYPVRAIISDAELVEMLWTRLAVRLDPPTIVRLSQPVYLLEESGITSDLSVMKYSSEDDLDVLVPACAAMHREEVGIDPLTRDAFGYRERIRELVRNKRSVSWIEKGAVIFKCEFSAVTRHTIQLMGVWTSPEYRRQGRARQGMAEICGHILGQKKTVTLFVNDFNTPAIRLYESLGFRQIGRNRALIW